jgi:hypothetical protein
MAFSRSENNWVMKPTSSVFGSEIWARDELVARYFGNVKDGAVSYNSLVVRVKDPARVRQAAEQIKRPTPLGSFEAFPEEEYYAKQNQTSQQFVGAIAFRVVLDGSIVAGCPFGPLPHTISGSLGRANGSAVAPASSQPFPFPRRRIAVFGCEATPPGSGRALPS